MRLIMLIAALLIPMVGFANTVYRWTDQDGIVYLSDEPHQGAEKIAMPKDDSQQRANKVHQSPSFLSRMLHFKRASTESEYRLVTILKPGQHETIHGGTLTVSVAVKPSLGAGNTLAIYLDGRKVASSKERFQFSIHHVDRGEHTLTAKIIKINGEVLASSDSTSVHVRRPYIRKLNRPKPSLGVSIKNFLGIKVKPHAS